MKQLLVFFMFLLVIPFECRANCIAGDCLNGEGTETHPNGEKYVSVSIEMATYMVRGPIPTLTVIYTWVSM